MILDRVAAVLGDARTVVVVAPDGLDLSPLDTPTRVVRRHAPGRDLADLHDSLAGQGHADAVVDLVRGPGAAGRLAVLAAHVLRGGPLVVAVPHRDPARTRLLDLVTDLRDLRDAGVDPPARRADPRPRRELDRHALAFTLDDLRVDDGLVLARCAVDTWSVVPEARLDALLAAEPTLGTPLASLAGERWSPAAPLRSTDPDEGPLPARDVPPLTLRAFDDVVVTRQVVAHTRDLVLPQAFRDPVRPRPRNRSLTDWTRWSVRVPAEIGPGTSAPEPLPGTWFHADNVLRGHFGHALTEQLSQLWAWPEVIARHPDAGVLVTAARRPLAGWELDLLEAAGVPRDRVHAAPRPVRVERLLAATPGYVVEGHVHPALRDTYAATGEALDARSTLHDTPARVFVTRRGPKRRCHETDEVEALAQHHGFTVLAPEDHLMCDQVALLRRAEVVAGFGGSGLFHLLLGGRPRPVVVVAHTAYHVWNEKAAAALWGHPLSIVRGRPDVDHARFTVEAFHSDYHVDLDAVDAELGRAVGAMS